MHFTRSISGDGPSNPEAEGTADLFALVIEDTPASSSFWRAKAFLSSIRLFGGARAHDPAEALARVVSRLGEAGFELVCWEGPGGPGAGTAGATAAAADAACAADAGAQRVALLLVRPSLALLRREVIKEELDGWLREHARMPGLEFTPAGATLGRADLTPARRIALAAPALADAAVEIRREFSRSHAGAVTLAAEPFPVHDLAFNGCLLRHLLRHWRLRSSMLHALRNAHGEKVAFHFAYNSYAQVRRGGGG